MDLNATPCDPEANSYLTLQEAGEMLGGFLCADKWDALQSEGSEASGEAIKIRLLCTAARLVDRYRAMPPRQVSGQALAFPTSKDPSEEIPKAVKLAVCEWIDAYLENGPLFQALKKAQAEGVTSMSELGQSSSFKEDASMLPAGARRELDRLIDSYDTISLDNPCRNDPLGDW
jgi:hypothetical protein